MAEIKIPNYQQINTIPTFLEEVNKAYGIEVLTNLPENHAIANLWGKVVTVTEGTNPDPCYTATGSINDEFPFNFAQDITIDFAKDFPFLTNQNFPPELGINLKIDVFQPAPQIQDRRGIKVTVFPVAKSDKYPNGIIVKKGLNFVDSNGNPVADDNLDTTKIPEESVVPPEAQVNLADI